MLQRRLDAEHLLLGGVALVCCLLVLYPLLILIVSMFRVDIFGQPSRWTLENFAYLASPAVLSATANTLLVSIGATLLAGLFGVLLAWIGARTDTPGIATFESLNVIPVFLSPYVGAVAWTYLAAPRSGLLNSLMHQMGLTGDPLSPYNIGGMIWVLGMHFVPYVYLFTLASLRRMDAALEEAARTSGSGLLQVLTRVTLPLALPGILSGAMLVFVSAAGDFGVPLALGHPTGLETLTTQIFVLTEDLPAKYNRAATAGAVLMLLSVGCVVLQRRVIARRDFTTVTGRTSSPRRTRLGRWKWLTLALNVAYLLLSVGLPLAALMVVATSRSWTGEVSGARLTLEHFGYAFTSPVSRTGLIDSLVLSVGGATLCVLLGLVLSLAIHRTRGTGRALVEVVTTIPIGVPGIVLALGILLAYIHTPLYATLGILLVGYISRFMPYGQHGVSSVLLALSPELEQSARVAGLSWLQAIRGIVVPLVWPGIVSAWLLLFVLFLRELPISLLLYHSGSEVLSVAIWQFVVNESASRAAALGLIQVVALLGAVAVFRRLTGSTEMLR